MIAVTLLGGCVEAEKVPAVFRLDPGFDHFYNLEYDQALEIFEAEAAVRPSANAFNHVAQTLVFRAMYRAGVLDSGMVASTRAFLHMPKVPMAPGDENDFLDAIRHAKEMARTAIQRDSRDANAWYALGVSEGLLGDYDLFVRKAYLDALHEGNAARTAHTRATDIDPDFIDARLTQGLYDYVVGSLPLGWKMLGFLGGYRGDRQRGIHTLELVAAQGHWNRIDAKVMLAAVYRREKKTTQAIAAVEDLIPRMPRNFLLPLELAQMYIEIGDPVRADGVLCRIERMKAENAPGYDRLPEDKIRAVERLLPARLAADPQNR